TRAGPKPDSRLYDRMVQRNRGWCEPRRSRLHVDVHVFPDDCQNLVMAIHFRRPYVNNELARRGHYVMLRAGIYYRDRHLNRSKVGRHLRKLKATEPPYSIHCLIDSIFTLLSRRMPCLAVRFAVQDHKASLRDRQIQQRRFADNSKGQRSGMPDSFFYTVLTRNFLLRRRQQTQVIRQIFGLMVIKKGGDKRHPATAGIVAA